MPDVTLSTGQEVTFDLSNTTIGKYSALFDPQQPEAEEFGTIAQLAGLDTERVRSLKYPDWKRLIGAIVKRVNELPETSEFSNNTQYDLSEMSIGEYRSIWGNLADENARAILSRVIAVPVDDINHFSILKYQQILRGLLDKAREPLADPN